MGIQANNVPISNKVEHCEIQLITILLACVHVSDHRWPKKVQMATNPAQKTRMAKKMAAGKDGCCDDKRGSL